MFSLTAVICCETGDMGILVLTFLNILLQLHYNSFFCASLSLSLLASVQNNTSLKDIFGNLSVQKSKYM